MARHAPVIEHAGNTVTVIAPTAEEAMALVGDAGPGFRTTSIGKIRRGGLGGFFATEMVRVVAEAPEGHPGRARGADSSRHVAPMSKPASLQLATADDLIASLCGSDGPFAGRLAAGLQQTLREPPVTRVAAVATAAEPESERPPVEPAAVDSPLTDTTDLVEAAPNGGAGDFWRSRPARCDVSDSGPERRPTAGAWSGAALEAAGLPAPLVDRVAGVRPHDEVTWNAALMLAVRDWCGAELPAGAVFAGPACADLAAALRVPVVGTAEVIDREGPVATPVASAAELAAAVGDRPVHLVVGGAWRHLATIRPATVSAATPDDLVDAVRAAIAWDVPLGWVVQADAPVRIDPFVVAAHVRALLAVDGPRVEPATPSPRGAPAPRGGRATAAARASARSGAGRQGAGR